MASEIEVRSAEAIRGFMAGDNEAIAKLNADEVVEALKGLVFVGVRLWELAGRLWKRAIELGIDMSDMRGDLLDFARLIAEGQLDPRVMHLFSGRRSALMRIKALPLTEQKRIASDEPMEVIVGIYDKGPETRLVRPTIMDDDQIRQVIGPTRIRNLTEQRNYFEHRHSHSGTGPVHEPVMPDKRRGGLVINGVFFQEKRILEALAELHR